MVPRYYCIKALQLLVLALHLSPVRCQNVNLGHCQKSGCRPEDADDSQAPVVVESRIPEQIYVSETPAEPGKLMVYLPPMVMIFIVIRFVIYIVNNGWIFTSMGDAVTSTFKRSVSFIRSRKPKSRKLRRNNSQSLPKLGVRRDSLGDMSLGSLKDIIDCNADDNSVASKDSDSDSSRGSGYSSAGSYSSYSSYYSDSERDTRKRSRTRGRVDNGSTADSALSSQAVLSKFLGHLSSGGNEKRKPPSAIGGRRYNNRHDHNKKYPKDDSTLRRSLDNYYERERRPRVDDFNNSAGDLHLASYDKPTDYFIPRSHAPTPSSKKTTPPKKSNSRKQRHTGPNRV